MKQLIVLIFLITSFSSKSQELLYVPDILNQQMESKQVDMLYNGTKPLDEITKNTSSKVLWLVHSDRDHNKLKRSDKTTDNGVELDFEDPLYVKKVSGSWLLVCNVDEEKELGWIHVNNLIISRYSLMTNARVSKGLFSIPRKGVVLNNINSSNADKIGEKKEYYSHPNISKGRVEGTPKKFQTLFIFKESNDCYLMGTTDYLSGGATLAGTKLYGWIAKQFVRDWNTRIALEPASTDVSMKEYQEILRGYEKKSDLNSCIETNFCKEISITEFKCEPIRNNEMRRPIINNITENIKEVICLTNNTELNPVYEQKLQNATKLAQKMNIVFVLDATQSMRPYYNSISKSLQKVIDYNEKIIDSDVKMGVIIYRDYADGDKQYNSLPLTSNINAVKSFINNTKCGSKDTDLPEAQFNGLINCLPKMGFNKAESNVIVLVGDCGNHKPDPQGYTLDMVVDILHENNINLINFQVDDDFFEESYMTFNEDAIDYINKSANKIVEGKGSSLKINFKNIGNNTYELVWDKQENDYVNMFGKFIFADGKPMQTSYLEQQIIKSLTEYTQTVASNIKTLTQLITTGPSGGKLTEGVILKIMKELGISRKEAIRFGDKQELTTQAYVAIDYLGNGTPSQVPVVFLTEKEKIKLRKSLKKMISGVYGSAEQKKIFKENVIFVCRTIIGQKTSTEVIENLTFNQIWQLILGVDFENTKMKNSILKDFTNDITRAEFDEFYSEFERKANAFCSKTYSNSDPLKSRRFTIAGSYLYWIPLTDLPGCGVAD